MVGSLLLDVNLFGFFYFEGISKLYLLGGGGFFGVVVEIGGGCVGDGC